jgi:hypothetical protein
MTCKNSHTLFSQTARKGSALTLALNCGNILSSLPWLTSQQLQGHAADAFAAPRSGPAASRQPFQELATRSHEGALALRCLVLLPPDRRTCPDLACSPLGFCWRHLAEAAAEHARLAPRAVDPGCASGEAATAGANGSCQVCRTPLNPALALAGDVTHPNCDPGDEYKRRRADKDAKLVHLRLVTNHGGESA